ncbi:MAG: GIY-YIG nuclease family protein [Methylophilaceae bacterium]|jgi:putative endonuclease|nr:GIY-YIG nuclease family protein [Methylophilaceae bacterium]NCA26706.1 GIY-YIG nuclease family protein [Methylophilaceae bacterium]
MSWWVYLLECRDGSFYAGITNDVEARFKAHKEGRGAKYTKSHPPVKVLAQKAFANRSEASSAEAQLKKMPKSQKITFFDDI